MGRLVFERINGALLLNLLPTTGTQGSVENIPQTSRV